jgi:hypothetical protein
MNKLMAMMITLSLLSVSCDKSGGSSSEESTESITNVTGDTGSDSGSDDPDNGAGELPDPSLPPAPPAASTLPAFALSFGANIMLYSFTNSQEDKYNEAVVIVKKVVATEEFRKRVLNFSYSGSKQFSLNNGLTNAQVYQSVLDAAEKLTPAKNNRIDLGVKLYYENNSVVGWTSPSINYINVNTKFFNSYDPSEVAGNLFHEWLHKVGYGHDSSATTRRPYSVPYAIGYMIRDIGSDFL